jgi:hypothetical protein
MARHGRTHRSWLTAPFIGQPWDMAFKLWHVPVRLATGAFILNSGLSKLNADKETAEQLHGFASTAYPQFQETPPEQFTKMLSTGEIAVGAALLTPSTGVAGAALMGFASMLGRLYLKTPGMHQEGNLRPTEQGTPVAKDVWMLGIGSALVIDALSDHLPGRK